MKKRFKIPLLHYAWHEGYIVGIYDPKTIHEHEFSDAYALPHPGKLGSDFEVQIVRQRRKVGGLPLYRFVSTIGYFRQTRRQHTSEDTRPSRLHVFRPGNAVVIERPVLRPQVCWTDGTVNHVVKEWGSGGVVIACASKDVVKPHFRMGTPDCPKCLAAMPKAIWVEYIIQHYDHPAVVEKAQNKVKAKARTRARFPVALERVATDWLED